MISKDSCIDRLETRLNACSLETLYTPTKNNSYPLIIGCYQLNESTATSDQEEHEKDENDNDNHNDNENGEKDEVNQNDESAETKEKASRSGELILYSINQDLKFGKQQQSTLDTGSGVLDGKWLQRGPFQFHESESYLYATANASGAINMYRLLDDDNSQVPVPVQLKHVGASDVDENGDTGLALSLAWDESSYSRNASGVCSTRIVSSYSKGTLALHNVRNDSNANGRSLSSNDDDDDDDNLQLQIEETHRWNAHTLFGCPAEVWTVCFASNGHYNTYADTVISGGDDCKMKLWDLRLCGNTNTNTNTKPVTVKSDFEAGITAVAYHPSLEHVFAVGSYDEVVRLWDMRKMGGEPLGKVNVGGGVWRIKWHPKDQSRMLVGAMHGGCRLVEIPDIPLTSSSLEDDDSEDFSDLSVNIIKEFTEHKSMAYGADWIYEENGDFEAAASCSFYDRQAFIWD